MRGRETLGDGLIVQLAKSARTNDSSNRFSCLWFGQCYEIVPGMRRVFTPNRCSFNFEQQHDQNQGVASTYPPPHARQLSTKSWSWQMK